MQIKKRILLLLNETSGKQGNSDPMGKIVTELTQRGCLVTVYPINPKLGLVSEDILATDLSIYDAIVCCGGDGTSNHVVTQMLRNGIEKPVGYIPSGSTNDFSKNLNGGKQLSLEECCQIIAADHTFSYDVGKINANYFNYIAAFGAFTKVSYDTPQNWKNVLGYGAYVLNVLGSIPEGLSYRNHVKIVHDGIEEEGDFLFGAVANTTSVAGLESPLFADAKLNDGKFEVILISAPNNLLDAHEITNKLLSGDTDDKHVKMITTNHIEFQFDQATDWTLDGEHGELGKRVVIDVLHSAIHMYVKE